MLTKIDKGGIIKDVPIRKDKYFIKLVIIQQVKTQNNGDGNY